MSDVKWDEIQPLEVSQEAIEQSILLLQKAGWMQEHDRVLTEGKAGRWIEQDDGYNDTIYQCSVCGEEFVTIEGTPADNLWNYCPNCGARME